jgi:surface antigen
MKPHLAVVSLLACAANLVLPTAASAQTSGLGFLSKGPMARYNDQDMRLLEGALGQALKAEQPGSAVEWRNDRSGASGAVTPERIFDQGGQPCRDLRIITRHRTQESSGLYTLCRRDGRWKLAQ